MGIALIELFFLSLLVWQASAYLHSSGVEALQKRAHDTVQLASSVLLDALIASDLASLTEQVRELGALTGVAYVRVQGFGRTLAETGAPASGTALPDATVDDVDDGIYDLQHTFEVAGQDFGTLEIGFSVRELRQIWTEAERRLLVIALMELVLVGLCSWLLAGYLTRRVMALRQASKDLQEGKPFKHLTDQGSDEISQTIQAFNAMSSELIRQKSELTAANQRLEAANTNLRRREAEFIALLEAAPDAIAMLNSDGRISFVNHSFERLFNRSRNTLHNTSLLALFSNDRPQSAGVNTPDLALGNQWQQVSVEVASGDLRFVEVHISAFESAAEGRSLVIIRDRTEAHNLAHAAKVSEQLKANLVDSSLDALITINREGQVTDFSPSAETIFGWRRTEIVGQPMHEFIIPHEFRSAHAKGMAHFLATGEGPLIGQRVETSALRRTGEIFPVELALTAITVEGELFVTASIRDISERKQKEQELIESKAEAEQASVAKSRFLSYMSHEIRSPLNAVLGSLSLMSDNEVLSPSGHRYLQLAQSSGDSLLQVVNEVLDFSKIEAGQMEFHRVQFELSPLINGVIDAIDAQRGKKDVRLGFKTDGALPSQVLADRDHLRQLLNILLDNACKFTEQGEVMVLVKHQDPIEPELEPVLVIDVTDTGPGIPEHLTDTIF
ncbi:PAS domain S-box protein, partial [Marinobacter sediminum]|uniref:PAS domain S-box protein n=1 Tax=Marinobacter sediminum TaxID=256323 RepID=UPI0035647420